MYIGGKERSDQADDVVKGNVVITVQHNNKT